MLEHMTGEEKSLKVPLVVLIGGGSRLPKILEYTQKSSSRAYVALVVSHKKESPGIDLALASKIPAVFCNFVEFKQAMRSGGEKARETYGDFVGYLASQSYYADRARGLVVMAGWDLVMPQSFLRHFDQKGRYRVINLHPSLLPDNPQDNFVILSNGEKIDISKMRGLHSNEAFEMALKLGHKWTGATAHWVTPKVDQGKVIIRGEVPIKEGDTVESLAQRVHTREDEILPKAIDMVV